MQGGNSEMIPTKNEEYERTRFYKYNKKTNRKRIYW